MFDHALSSGLISARNMCNGVTQFLIKKIKLENNSAHLKVEVLH